MSSAYLPSSLNGVFPGENDRHIEVSSELQELLEDHSMGEIAKLLGDYLGIGTDSISLMMFICLAAGRLRAPFNIEVYSDDPGSENLIADRIINMLPETVKRAETIKAFRDLADTNYEDTELVLVRSCHNVLRRFACEAACRDTAKSSPPSILLISDDQATTPRYGPTLALMARQTDRSMAGFGYQFSRGDELGESPSYVTLRQLLLQLAHRKIYGCPFHEKIRAALKPSDSLIFNRVLVTIAALRIEMINLSGTFLSEAESVVTIDDYRVARSLLSELPIPGELSRLSPYAAETGAILYEAIVTNSSHQKTIPDHSEFGNKVFTRQQAVEECGHSYNTVKDHLKRLEDEGVVESMTVREQRRNSMVRKQGVQVYYRFKPTRSPPFGTSSPFASLPTVEQIAAECKFRLQSQQEGAQ